MRIKPAGSPPSGSSHCPRQRKEGDRDGDRGPRSTVSVADRPPWSGVEGIETIRRLTLADDRLLDAAVGLAVQVVIDGPCLLISDTLGTLSPHLPRYRLCSLKPKPLVALPLSVPAFSWSAMPTSRPGTSWIVLTMTISGASQEASIIQATITLMPVIRQV